MRLLAIPLLLSVLVACRGDVPDDHLADAYVDLLRFRDRAARADSVAIRTGVDSVLAAHGLDTTTYRDAFAALAADAERLPAFYARVEQRMAATNPALQPDP